MRNHIGTPISILFLYVAVYLCSVARALIDPAQKAALIELYQSTNGPNWINNNGWRNFSTDPCTVPLWNGVSCDYTRTNVRFLILPDNGLSGPLPDVFDNFVALEQIQLQNNQLTGSLPPSLANCSALTNIDLHNNQLTGSIPPSIGSLTNLNYIDLSENGFTGPLPPLSPDMDHLFCLFMRNNQLTGPIPTSWFNELPRLALLDISNNNLTGSLPANPNLPKLLDLNLGYNQLNGTIPSKFAQLTALRRLILRNNMLSGPLPAFLNSLTQLTSLDLAHNNFNGDIPNLSALSSLTYLDLSYNNMSGSIPISLSNLPLRSISLQFNSFTGTLSPLVYIQTLQYLDVAYNCFTSIASMSVYSPLLSYLNVSGNMITGDALYYLVTLASLQRADLSNNRISGKFPTLLPSSLVYLSHLNIANNSIYGPLPADIGAMAQLNTLNLSGNKLSGTIPPSITNIKYLNFLDLSRNQFSGAIPRGLSIHLEFLDLSNNAFTGSILFLSELQILKFLDLSSNRFEGDLSSFSSHLCLEYVNVSNNTFGGNPPIQLGSPYLTYFDFSSNEMLCGIIPPNLCSNGIVSRNLDSIWCDMCNSTCNIALDTVQWTIYPREVLQADFVFSFGTHLPACNTTQIYCSINGFHGKAELDIGNSKEGVVNTYRCTVQYVSDKALSQPTAAAGMPLTTTAVPTSPPNTLQILFAKQYTIASLPLENYGDCSHFVTPCKHGSIDPVTCTCQCSIFYTSDCSRIHKLRTAGIVTAIVVPVMFILLSMVLCGLAMPVIKHYVDTRVKPKITIVKKVFANKKLQQSSLHQQLLLYHLDDLNKDDAVYDTDEQNDPRDSLIRSTHTTTSIRSGGGGSSNSKKHGVHHQDHYSVTAVPSKEIERMMGMRKKFDPYSWRIHASEVQLREKIGSGAFGQVYRGIFRNTTEVAIKLITVKNKASSSKNSLSSHHHHHYTDNLLEMSEIDRFILEMSIWEKLKHPNIVMFIGASVDDTDPSLLMIVSEYMSNGTLESAFKNHRDVLTWELKLKISAQIASAMASLHERQPPILHRDLKGSNILLDENFVAKVSDFGLSKEDRYSNTQTMVGTPYWMSPEIIRGEPYGAPSDVYSFGIVMWQILTERSKPYEEDVFKVQYRVTMGERPPVPDVTELAAYHVGKLEKQKQQQQQQSQQLFGTSISNNYGYIEPSSYLDQVASSIELYVKLMRECWDGDPAVRPDFFQITKRLEQMNIDMRRQK